MAGVTSASAPQPAIYMLAALKRLATVEAHLVLSCAGCRTVELETGLAPRDLADLADVTHHRGDLAAPIACGGTARAAAGGR